jgi:hypothetical protein
MFAPLFCLSQINIDGKSCNFAEAALLIQGSTFHYSRKVESLLQLVYASLNAVSAKKRRISLTSDGKAAADGSFDLDGDMHFLELDWPATATNIDLKETQQALRRMSSAANRQLAGYDHHRADMNTSVDSMASVRSIGAGLGSRRRLSILNLLSRSAAKDDASNNSSSSGGSGGRGGEDGGVHLRMSTCGMDKTGALLLDKSACFDRNEPVDLSMSRLTRTAIGHRSQFTASRFDGDATAGVPAGGAAASGAAAVVEAAAAAAAGDEDDFGGADDDDYGGGDDYGGDAEAMAGAGDGGGGGVDGSLMGGGAPADGGGIGGFGGFAPGSSRNPRSLSLAQKLAQDLIAAADPLTKLDPHSDPTGSSSSRGGGDDDDDGDEDDVLASRRRSKEFRRGRPFVVPRNLQAARRKSNPPGKADVVARWLASVTASAGGGRGRALNTITERTSSDGGVAGDSDDDNGDEDGSSNAGSAADSSATSTYDAVRSIMVRKMQMPSGSLPVTSEFRCVTVLFG